MNTAALTTSSTRYGRAITRPCAAARRATPRVLHWRAGRARGHDPCGPPESVDEVEVQLEVLGNAGQIGKARGSWRRSWDRELQSARNLATSLAFAACERSPPALARSTRTARSPARSRSSASAGRCWSCARSSSASPLRGDPTPPGGGHDVLSTASRRWSTMACCAGFRLIGPTASSTASPARSRAESGGGGPDALGRPVDRRRGRPTPRPRPHRLRSRHLRRGDVRALRRRARAERAAHASGPRSHTRAGGPGQAALSGRRPRAALVATGAYLIALVAALLATTPWHRDPRPVDDAARRPAFRHRRAARAPSRPRSRHRRAAARAPSRAPGAGRPLPAGGGVAGRPGCAGTRPPASPDGRGGAPRALLHAGPADHASRRDRRPRHRDGRPAGNGRPPATSRASSRARD